MSSTDQLYEIISKILLLDTSEISDELSREEVEDWDSMTHLVLISELEKEYDVRFDDDEVAEMENIADVKASLKGLGVELDN